MVYYGLADEHVRLLLEVALQHARHGRTETPAGGR
jgi:hypothetical protein